MCIACIFVASIFCFTIGYLLGCANTTDRFIEEQKDRHGNEQENKEGD